MDLIFNILLDIAFEKSFADHPPARAGCKRERGNRMKIAGKQKKCKKTMK